MERLTRRVQGEALAKGPIYPVEGGYFGGKHVARLAAYEDTGFTPEDVRDLAKEFNDLIECIRNIYGWCTGCANFKGGCCGIDMIATCMTHDCYTYNGLDAIVKELRKYD